MEVDVNKATKSIIKGKEWGLMLVMLIIIGGMFYFNYKQNNNHLQHYTESNVLFIEAHKANSEAQVKVAEALTGLKTLIEVKY